MNKQGVFEFLGILFNLTYSVLYLLEIQWCWLFAILGGIFYFILCLKSKLIGESILQLIYIFGAALVWCWPNSHFETNYTGTAYHLFVLAISLVIWGISFTIFKNRKGNLPVLDSFIFSFAITGTYYQLMYDPINWYYFICVNLLSIYTFWKSGMKFSILLYLTYIVLCIIGITQ
jgi:nicotinamide riboside transporter PnuC